MKQWHAAPVLRMTGPASDQERACSRPADTKYRPPSVRPLFRRSVQMRLSLPTVSQRTFGNLWYERFYRPPCLSCRPTNIVRRST